MPRKAQFPPKIYTHPRTGKAFVRIRQDGRVTDVTLGAPGSPEASARYAEVLGRLQAGQPATVRAAARSAAALTVLDVVSRFTAEELPRYDPAGREAEQYTYTLRPLVALFAALPAADLGTGQLRQLQLAMATGSWMTEEEQQRELAAGRPVGWCAAVVNRRIVRVRTVWRWAEERGLVPRGSWGHLCSVRGLEANDARVRHSQPQQATVDEDLAAAVPHCSRVIAAMLGLQHLSGMRSGEVRTLRTADVDRSGAVWLYRPRRHKTAWRGHSRVVVLGPEAQAILGPWLRPDVPEGYCFRPLARRRGKDGLEVYREGCYSDESYSRAVARACKRAGVKLIPYGGRVATKERVTRAAGLDAARSVLGQKSLSTTDGYGQAVDLKTAAEVAKRLG
jgi:integrase